MKHKAKKLIEVAIPLDEINAASAGEKAIRQGHPSALHQYWSRKPLVACRAVLFAQLVDDPSSHPERFPTPQAVNRERQRLFKIIKDLVRWENSTDEDVLKRARAEIIKSCDGRVPSIYDPFSGGGSIPFEALRLGLPAYGSDLNPVAVVIGKGLIEIPPRFKDRCPVHPGGPDRLQYCNADGLAEDVKYYGNWMRKKAFKRIGHLYPRATLSKEHDGNHATVLAWIWARTVPSPDPAFSDVSVPIVSSFVLSKKPGSEAWIEPVVDKYAKKIKYNIRKRGTKQEIILAGKGTKMGHGSNFKCLISGSAISSDYVKHCGRNGRINLALIAIVCEGKGGRIYTESQVEHEIHTIEHNELDFGPQIPISGSTQYLGIKPYGIDQFHQLFTDRQLVALNTFSDLVNEVRPKIKCDALLAGFPDDNTPLSAGGNGAMAYADAISVYLYFCVGKLADLSNSLCRWEPAAQCPRNLFGRQAIPMIWEFAEANIFSSSSGSFEVILAGIFRALSKNAFNYPDVPTSIIQADAADTATFLAPSSRLVISSDPPYYDNIPYADISDFFYCWMKKALRPVYPDLFDFLTTPKQDELIAAPHRHGDKESAEKFFLNGMSKAIANMARHSSDSFPTTIYYAFKQREVEDEGISSTGWATFLQAVIKAGYAVVGTWPIRTENSSRLRGQRSNALASSIVLVCRQRDLGAGTIGRSDFVRTLKREMHPSIEALKRASIAPSDMPQAAIGPGMAVFSRFSSVLEADDKPMSTKTALQLINRELDDYLSGIEGDFDAETRFALTWFESYGFQTGSFDAANSVATARGISVDAVRRAGIVEASAGDVRILARDDLDPAWKPRKDVYLTVWECSWHLARALDEGGERRAAVLLKQLGSVRVNAVKDLAYCLYDIAENKRRDASEAATWNSLITVWPELTEQAAMLREDPSNLQDILDF